MAVMTVTATDADGNTLSYSLSGGADQAAFSIDAASGALSFNSAPDYEVPSDASSDNVYEVQVSVSDGASSTTQDISVTVTNVNDNTPVITSTATPTIVENTTAVVNVAASDADGDILSYSLSGGTDQASFSIDATSGALSFASAPDYEVPSDANSDNVYEVQVSVSDGASSTKQDISVTVTNVNDNTPVITSTPTPTIVENTTAVVIVTASDADGDAVSYSLSGGTDQASFSIDATSGTLSFTSAPDYEVPSDANSDNVYEVQVAVSDGATSTTQNISVTVTNANDNAPLITSTATPTVVENTTAVVNVAASDADGNILSYSLSGGADQAAFTIDAVSGFLSFVSAPDADSPTDAAGAIPPPDIGGGVFAGDNVYVVQVSVSDGVYSTAQDISVTVTKQPPTSVSITSSTSDKVELSWAYNDSTFTKVSGIAIARKNGAGGTYAVVGSVPATQTTFIDTGLSPGTAYYYKLYAYASYDPKQISTYTSEVSVTTQSFMAAPVAPSGLVASADNGWTVSLTWSDNSTNEDGFVIERSSDGVNYSEIVTVNNGVTSFRDEYVIASTSFYYRVKAYNNQGSSTYTTPYNLTTPAITPTDLSGGIAADTTLTLSNSPYLVSSSVSLAPGYTLTIESGVHIRFAPSTGIEIRGHLDAVGTDDAPILFAASNPTTGSQNYWTGIHVANILGGSAEIQHVYVSNATNAISVDCCHIGGPVDIYDSVFDTNITAINSYAGNLVIPIYRSRFTNNTAGVNSADKIIAYSIFNDNSYGLYQTERIDVYYSRFIGNTNTALYGRMGSVSYCTIMNNSVGIQAFLEGFDVSYNIIADNADGLIVGSYNGYSPAVQYNNIFGNTNYSIVNNDSGAKEATNNWWGLTDTAVIDAGVFDFYDDAALGIINYSPFINSPVDIIP